MKKHSGDLVLDPNFVTTPPTKVLTAERGSVRVVTKLYGTVTPEREAAEQRITNYRCDQMTPAPVRQRREPVIVKDRMSDLIDMEAEYDTGL